VKRFFAVLFSALVFMPTAYAVMEPGANAIKNYRNEVILPAPSEHAEKKTRNAILESAFLRGWKIAKDTPPVLQLRLDVRNKYTVVVNVTIKGDKVDVDYVSSVNMEHKKNDYGIDSIHPNYNRWIANLLKAARAKAASAD
jgi:hypothetical protein